MPAPGLLSSPLSFPNSEPVGLGPAPGFLVLHREMARDAVLKLPSEPHAHPVTQGQIALVPVSLVPPPHLPFRVTAVEHGPHGTAVVADQQHPVRRRWWRLLFWI